MDSFLQVVFYSIPYVIAAALAALLVVIGAFSASRPLIVVAPFLAILFWFSDISYGKVEASVGSIFSRGAGYLLFPAFIWAIGLAFTWIKVSQQFSKQSHFIAVSNLNAWFTAWLLLLGTHVAIAVMTSNSLRGALGPAGFSNIIWTWLFMMTMLAAFKSERDAKLLLNSILYVGLARAIFGLVRWVIFGGDPANAYENRHGLDIKLTFFDIYDSLICMLTVCVAAMKLFPKTRNISKSVYRSLFLWVAIIVPLVCIVLSFRRTALIGMIIGGSFLLLQLPPRARFRLIAFGFPVMLAGLGYAIWKRLSQTKQAASMLDFFFDVTPHLVGPDSPRFLELKLAWASFIEHPIFGVGAWGNYEGWKLISWQLYEGGGGTYLHSGILHIGLKAGILGLVLLAGLVVSVTMFWRRSRNSLNGDLRILAVAGIVGCLFVIPDFIIGTSFTKHRAMLFIGFCLSLPYIAYAAELARESLKLPQDSEFLQDVPQPRIAALVGRWSRLRT